MSDAIMYSKKIAVAFNKAMAKEISKLTGCKYYEKKEIFIVDTVGVGKKKAFSYLKKELEVISGQDSIKKYKKNERFYSLFILVHDPNFDETDIDEHCVFADGKTYFQTYSTVDDYFICFMKHLKKDSNPVNSLLAAFNELHPF